MRNWSDYCIGPLTSATISFGRKEKKWWKINLSFAQLFFFFKDVSSHCGWNSQKGPQRLTHKTSKHSLKGPVATMATARKSLQTFILKKVNSQKRKGRRLRSCQSWQVCFWGQQSFAFSEAQFQAPNCHKGAGHPRTAKFFMNTTLEKKDNLLKCRFGLSFSRKSEGGWNV